MRGWYANVPQEELAEIPEIIEDCWAMLTGRYQIQVWWEKSEANVRKREIHDREYERLSSAEAGIFEISNPSLGVGAEISDMLHQDKPILLIYKYGLLHSISAYILGKQGSEYMDGQVITKAYKHHEELKEIITEFITTLEI